MTNSDTEKNKSLASVVVMEYRDAYCEFSNACKRDWINSCTIKILFMISEHIYRKPEVGVKFCMNDFSKLVYCRVFI